MKKRTIWIFLGGFFAVVIIFLICLYAFLSKTTSPIEQYCIENTAINATSFGGMARMEHDAGIRMTYVYLASENGLPDKQELFIFQQVQFGPFESSIEWNRYRLAYHVLCDADEIVGSFMFTPRDTRNRELSMDWIVFYSSNQYHISRCIFTVWENGEIRTLEGGMATQQAFAATLTDLGLKNGVLREFIKAEFFDGRGNLIKTIEGNDIFGNESMSDMGNNISGSESMPDI